MVKRSIGGLLGAVVLGGTLLTGAMTSEASAEPLYLKSRNKNRAPRTTTRNGDWDRDGVRNYRDRDDDNDGVPDSRDRYDYRKNNRRVYVPPVRSRVVGRRADLDRDGIPDYRDNDRDGDGRVNSRDRYPNDRRRR